MGAVVVTQCDCMELARRVCQFHRLPTEPGLLCQAESGYLGESGQLDLSFEVGAQRPEPAKLRSLIATEEDQDQVEYKQAEKGRRSAVHQHLDGRYHILRGEEECQVCRLPGPLV